MTLQQLQHDAKNLAQELYKACLNRHQGHPLFRGGMFNAGFWRGRLGGELQRNISTEEATFYAAFLPVDLPSETNKDQPWPWQQRTQSNSRKKTKDWIQILLDLDDHATIFVDVIPDLGTWICDIFNYIPRDVWSMATHLIARFYRSSKQLFATTYGHSDLSTDELEEIRSQFFFAKIDTSLEELFDFNKSINRGTTTRQIFCHLEEEQANAQYGKHAHVHRHSLYLLFQVALLDADWQGKLFNASSNAFPKHILKIKDNSCLSVLYTSLLEVCYFDGHQSTLNWSTIQSLEIDAPAPNFPASTSTTAFANWQPVSEELIRKKVLKIRALKSNIQLVMRFHVTNKIFPNASSNPRTTQLYNDVQDWMGSHQTQAEWQEFKYDYLAKWLQTFNDPSKSSLLHNHIKTVDALSPLQQRKKLIEHYKLFIGKEDYALTTEEERKQAFFELWHLLSMPKMFEDAFGTHLIETRIPLIFEQVEGLNQSMLEFVKAQFEKKEIGKTEYSKLIVLLAILVQEQKLNCHDNDLGQLIRDGIFERLFVLETTTDDTIFSKNGITNYSVSPIAVWFMNASDFRAYRTPLLFQIIQSFLMDCRSEAQKFHLFWRLSIYEPDDEIYKLFAKNLQFPFHLLKDTPVKYTNIDWVTKCDLLQKLSAKQDRIDHDLNPSPSRRSVAPIEILKQYGEVWKPFIDNNRSVFLLKNDPAWDDTSWNNMVSFWEKWTQTEIFDTYLQFKDWLTPIESFFTSFQNFLSTIFHDASVEPIREIMHQIDVICDDLAKSNESDFEDALHSLCEKDPHCLQHKVPFELNFMYGTVVSKLQEVMKKVVHTEKKHLKWDTEIVSPNIKFDKVASYFSTDNGYWKHTQEVFEPSSVENLIAKSCIEKLDQTRDWTNERCKEVFQEYREVFKHYEEENLYTAYSALMKQIIENSKMLGEYHVPLWINMLKMIDQIGIPSEKAGLLTEQKEKYDLEIKEYEKRQFLEWDKEIQSVNITFKNLSLFLTCHEKYWSHTQDVFEPSKVEDFIAKSWIDNLRFSNTWSDNEYSLGLQEYESVFKYYRFGLFRGYQSLIDQVVTNPGTLGKQYYSLLMSILKRLKELRHNSESQATDIVKQDKEKFSTQLDAQNKFLRKHGLFTVAGKLSDSHEDTGLGGKLLRFGRYHCFTPFVSSVVSLTLLLDFGDSLLHLYDYNNIASISSVVLSMITAFLYPYFSKHQGVGLPKPQSILNSSPSFGASAFFSGVVTLIWALSAGGPPMGLPPFLLMLFFTTIVKAAADGAFDTDT